MRTARVGGLQTSKSKVGIRRRLGSWWIGTMIHCQCHLADKNGFVAHWFIARRAVLFHVPGQTGTGRTPVKPQRKSTGKKGPLRWVLTAPFFLTLSDSFHSHRCVSVRFHRFTLCEGNRRPIARWRMEAKGSKRAKLDS